MVDSFGALVLLGLGVVSQVVCAVFVLLRPRMRQSSSLAWILIIIVLPGVGHFADCAQNLRARDGLVEALEQAVMQRGVPFFGICVGQQLLATRGLEDGETPGLNWLPGDIDRITPGEGLAVPHMGWNALELKQDHPVLAGLGEAPHLRGDEREATPDLAGPHGLERAVEREQVAALGDLVDLAQ